MANITSTQVDSVIPTVIASQTLGYLASNMMLAALVNRDYDTAVAQYGDTVSIGKRGTLTANDKAASTSVTKQGPAHTAQNVVLNKHKEVTIVAEDLALMFARPNLIAGYAEDAAVVLMEAIEGDLAALYSGFSQTIDATGGFTEANIREAGRLLNAAKAPVSRRFAVLHEDAYSDAQAFSQLINADYQGPATFEAVQNGLLGRYSGFDIFLNQNIKVASSQCKNLFGHRNAAVLATRPMRQTDRRNVEQTVMIENDIALRVTMSYDADALAEQLTIDVLYGVAELRDDHAVVMSTTEK